MSKFQPRKGYELVMEEIKRRIIEEEISPGDKLDSVVALAESFGVGRSTVREALSALKAMGWLDIRQGGGTFVKDTLPTAPAEVEVDLFQNADSLKEMLEVRKVLETGCAALAAKHRTQEHIQQLQHILTDMSAHINDEIQSEQDDVRFHLAIAQASGNSLLVQLMESLNQRLQDTMKDTRKLWFFAERSSALRLLKEHQQIAGAIENQQTDEAYRFMLQHLEKVESVLQQR